MKKILLPLLFFISMSTIFAQQKDSAVVPNYKKYPTVPAMKLMQADSTFFIVKDLVKKNKATVIIIFSPTCGHCQHQAEEITSHIADLKNITFVFSTTYNIKDMQQYISDYGLDKFPNIHVGYDKGYNMGGFYHIQSLPGIFVYDKKGKFVATFETNVKAQTFLDAINNKKAETASIQ